MWIELGAAAYLIGRYIYHRITYEAPIEHKSFKVFSADDGEVIPLIYGRCRVDNVVPAWVSKPRFDSGGVLPAVYQCNLFFVLGIPFADGSGTNRLHNVYQGDVRFNWRGFHGAPELPGTSTTQTGDGNFEDPLLVDYVNESGEFLGPYVEFLNGNPAQILNDSPGDPTTYAAMYMMDTGTSDHLPSGQEIPREYIAGYRGYMSATLHAGDPDFDNAVSGAQWRVGGQNTVPNYSFEVSSYAPGYYPWGLQIGPDCNPVDVIYDILVAKFGKLGMDTSTFVDFDSFVAAAEKLVGESHGYSRALQEPKAAEEWIIEILKQIDAAMYEDPSTGKLKLKLIRNDYDPTTLVTINKFNCSKLENFAAGGWTGVINKLKLVYTNRDDMYREASVTVQNMANAVGQDGVVREQVIKMLGVTNQWLAYRIAERELQARSRPQIKCRVIVDRSLIRLNQGDPVRVTWTDPDFNLIFRVANVSHGVINDGKVALDLIQDYFYTYRGSYPSGGGLTGGGEVFGPDSPPPMAMG